MTKENLNYYEKALNDFEHFCDEFENAANKRFQGVDDGSTPKIKNQKEERATTTDLTEVKEHRAESEEFREPPINVQATHVEGVLDIDADVE